MSYRHDNLSKSTLEKKDGEIKNGQPRDTGNIRYIRHRANTTQRHWQHKVQTTQGEDKQNTKTQHNPQNKKMNKMDSTKKKPKWTLLFTNNLVN